MTTKARKLAEQIVNDLFMLGGTKTQAKRLVLELPRKELDGPGWGKQPMIDRVTRHLEEAFADDE